MYRPACLVADDLVAIDMHTHLEMGRDGRTELAPELTAAATDYFRMATHHRPSVHEMAGYFRSRKMAAVVFTIDAQSATGHAPIPNDELAQACSEHPDALIPFASLDPWRGRAAVREAGRLVDACGVRGFKFHPNIQAFAPNDPMAYPLYETIEALDVPVIFHTGQTGIGAGVRGGGGIRLKYSDPMLVDDIAVDFPDLRIVLAHPSFPWQDEALAIATHKPNVYIDLSGWSPKYFPANLVRYADTILRDKILFGSDYPLITPDRWIAEFETLDIRPAVRPLILKENALRLLRLAPDGSGAASRQLHTTAPTT